MVRIVSIHETAEGTYRARIRDARGRQITKTFRLKGDAQAWERTQLQNRDAGDLVTGGKITVADWADLWLTNARSLADGTRATYRRDLDSYILPALGGIKLGRLTAEDIDAFLAGELDEYAPSTVHRHYRTIHRMCEVAVKRHRIATNPAGPVEPPKVPTKEMRFLSVDQLEAVAARINPRYRTLILVAGYGGLRWGELQALKPAHVDGNALTVIEQVGSTDVKTKASRRRVVLPVSVGADLAAHLAEYPGKYVFTNGAGKVIAHSSFSGHHWKTALVKAGVDRDTRLHDLRHTAAALAIQAGAHPKLIADMLGHSSITVTMNLYGHLFPAMHDDVAAKVDEIRQAGRHLRVV